ncbi:MAG: KOW motif domain-containing protein [Desulfuromonadales bacterium]|nr:KOW motif domain-containing protein [Desulfuromonadales bacterium]
MGIKKARIRKEVSSFVQQYERKAPKKGEPNDRNYSRQVEGYVKSMDPAELSELINGDGTHIPPEIDEPWSLGESVPEIQFQLEDTVEVLKGKHTGKTGKVVSLIEILPETRYLLKLDNGLLSNVLESQIKRL